MRQFILQYRFRSYLDLTGKKVFGDAIVDPSVISIKKEIPDEQDFILVNNDFKVLQNRLDQFGWNFEEPESLDLKDKFKSFCIEIKDIDGLNINFGVKTGYNKSFIINEQLKNDFIAGDQFVSEIIKPVIRGKDVQRYRVDYKNLYLLYISWKFPIKNFIQIENYLSNFKENLEKRPEVKSGRGDWFSLSRYAAAYYKDFNNEKILWTDMAQKPAFTLDNTGLYPLNTVYMMTITNENYDLRFILTLLNSKLLFWYFKGIGSNLGKNGLRYFKQFVEKLPIYPATPYINKNRLSKKLIKC